jgi:hypothetical protein
MSDTSPTLPPLGQIGEDKSGHGGVASYLSLLVRESVNSGAEWSEIADQCVTTYTHGDSPAPTSDKITLHKIQNAVITDTLIQMRNPPHPALKGRDAGAQAPAYWTGPATVGAGFGLPPEMAAALVPIPPEYVDPFTYLMERAAPVPVPLPNGMPVLIGFKEEWLTQIDVATVTSVYQDLHDEAWENGKVDLWLKQNLLDNNAQGWSWGLYEWDQQQMCPKLRHLSIHQVYIDPICRDISQAAYAGLDFVLDADEAKRLYPALTADIEEKAATTLNRPDHATYLGSVLEGTTFERKTVTLRIFWLRNQPIPMQVEEAIAAGRILAQQVPDEAAITPEAITPPMGEGMMGEAGGMMAEEGMMSPEPAAEPMMEQGVGAGMMAQPTPLRTALTLPDTQEEVTQSSPNWPTRPGIRQITLLVDAVVDDRECEFWDIPLVHNVCIPLIGNRPWGIGEPHRLKNLQRGASQILDNGVKYTDAYAHPGAAMPQSVYDATKAVYPDAHIDPTTTMIIPDDTHRQFGKDAVVWYQPPEWAQSNFQVYGELSRNLTEISGNQDILQGISGKNQSGVAIASLQGQATSLIEFKGLRTGDVAERISNLILWDIQRRMSLEDVAKVVDRYPPNVLAAILERGSSMQWQWSLENLAGSEAAKAQKRAETVEYFKAALLDERTAQERLEIDYRQVAQRKDAQMARQAQAAMPMAVAGAGPAQPPQAPQPPGIPGGGQPGAF